jgi:hypothetical protein
LLLIPSNSIAKEFVEIIYEGALEHYYRHHDHYELLILMDDGTPVHHTTMHKKIGGRKLEWPPNSFDLNPVANV